MGDLAVLMLGIVLLVGGAELVVRGGTRVATHFGVSPLVVGLTVVAVGTSTPELAVGVDAALQGAGSIAIGNVAGTNTVNLLLILGLSAAIRPLSLDRRSVRIDLPVMVAAAIALILMTLGGSISRVEGAVLVVAGIVYLILTVRSERRVGGALAAELVEEFGEPEQDRPGWSVAPNLALLIVGIVLIVVGADLLVDAAVDFAREFGVTEAFIGLTVVALGTSAPEFVTMLVSTVRGGRDIALGNILGSSTLNIVAILGMTALVSPNPIEAEPDLVRIDLPVMGLATLACIPVFLNDRRISRLEGGLFVTAYVAYLGWLLIGRT